MTALEELLRMPNRPRQREWAWKQLTNADTLFQGLHSAVRNRAVVEAFSLVSGWQKFVDTKRVEAPTHEAKQVELQWDTIRALAWCAEQAERCGGFDLDKLQRICFATDNPSFITGKSMWAWGCIRTFMDTVRRAEPVEVAVAGWNTVTQQGFLATLVLEVLQPGVGQVFHHPADGFTTHCDPPFQESIQDAWIAARELARGVDREILGCDGRWRLLQGWQLPQKAPPLPQANDRSASGAASRGWWHALLRKVPDKELIVLAEINSNGVLIGVDDNGVAAKVMTIAIDERFDTIVVASDDNEREATSKLNALGKSSLIRVKNLNASNT